MIWQKAKGRGKEGEEKAIWLMCEFLMEDHNNLVHTKFICSFIELINGPVSTVETQWVINMIELWRNCFLDFAVEHWFVCRATEPGFAGDIGAIEVWLIDWLIEKVTELKAFCYRYQDLLLFKTLADIVCECTASTSGGKKWCWSWTLPQFSQFFKSWLVLYNINKSCPKFTSAQMLVTKGKHTMFTL